MTEPEHALLDAIYAAPADDAPRLVYGDWLMSRGDPRGELIALQCATRQLTATDEARIEELLDACGESIAGPLAPVLRPHEFEIRRGFLAEAEVSWTRELVATLGEHPAWATVEKLELRSPAEEFHDKIQQHVPHTATALRELRGVVSAGIVNLAEAKRPWSIETLGCRPHDGDEPNFEATASLGATRLLPRLRRLELENHGRAVWLFGAPYWGSLEQLALTSNDRTTLREWTPVIAAHPRLVHVTIDQPQWRVRLVAERDGHDAPWNVRIELLGIWRNSPAERVEAAGDLLYAILVGFGPRDLLVCGAGGKPAKIDDSTVAELELHARPRRLEVRRDP